MPIPTPDSIVDAIKYGELPPCPTQDNIRAWQQPEADTSEIGTLRQETAMQQERIDELLAGLKGAAAMLEHAAMRLRILDPQSAGAVSNAAIEARRVSL